MLKGKCLLYSGATSENITGSQVLIIDNIGMLSSLYRYGQLAYIGGGFGKGIHNILEAAVWGIPVIFGPNFRKFREAVDLVQYGGGFSVTNFSELNSLITALRNDPATCLQASVKAAGYVKQHTGATSKIMQQLFPH